MNQPLSTARRIIRRVACWVLPPVFILVAMGVLAIQFIEINSRTELLSLTSFLVLLTFSALAFNWCRVSPDLLAPERMRTVYEAAVDFFVASLLALVSTVFAWLQGTPVISASACAGALFALHWFFLLASIILLLVAMLALLQIVSHPTK